MDLHPDFKDLLVELGRANVDDVVYLGVEPVRIDILRRADGVDTDEVIRRADRVEVSGLSIAIISLDDLITNKRASGRPQDLADVALLERVRRR